MSKSRIIFLCLLLFSLVKVFPQGNELIRIEELDITDPFQLREWVINTLHGGGGEFDTASIQFSGNPLQIGKFQSGLGSIGMDSGLVISTGEVAALESYNNRSNDSHNFYGTFDPDLNRLMEEVTGPWPFPQVPHPYAGDAAILEFIYIPYGDEIELQYVFGSEEYKYEQVPAPPPDDINLTEGPYSLDPPRMYDVFGISIDRPNGSYQNLAVLPPLAGGSAVSINSVNANDGNPNYTFYNPNPIGQASKGIQWDGYTDTLAALKIRKSVASCVKYRIKISVQDFLGYTREGEPDTWGYHWNSGVHVGGGSLIGGADAPRWTTSYEWTSENSIFEGKMIEGGCNDLLVTFTLEFASNNTEPYYIPFRIESGLYRDNLRITYADTDELLPGDSIVFNFGEIEKTIRVSAVNLDSDLPLVRFTYPQTPCERPKPPFSGGDFSGKIPFEMINNEPFSFSVNPKVYSAYCKETIELTVADITSGGVDPVTYIWPESPVPPVEVYNHTVNASPDFVPVQVIDLCGNDATVQVRIDNKPIQLVDIPTISFCKPGMSQLVEVLANPNFHDFPGYGFSNVDWLSLAYTPPQDLGSGNPKLIQYDDNFVELVYQIKYNVTDVCGATTTDTLTVDQTGKLDVGDDQYICKGESIELINFTPVFDDDQNNYRWFRRIISSSNIEPVGTGNMLIDTPPDTAMYYLEIFDACEETQIDSLIVYVDHFEPQIAVLPDTKEVCPGESVTLTANQANSYLWSPGGATTQSITVTETNPGVYSYTVTASSDYCFDKTATESFEVFPQPAAVFSFDPAEEACTGEDIQFNYDDDPTDKVFDWDFDDGTTSTLPNPVHAYADPGTYNVRLHVQQYICEDEITLPVLVNPLPSPEFSVDITEGCLPVDVQFTDNSSDIFPGAEYEWTFGDGNTSSQESPAHQYTTPGIFSVSLTVSNTERCFASITKPNLVQANPNPLADFEADPWITTLDEPTIIFINETESDSAQVQFDWDFGDGNTSSNENPENTYEVAGEYEVFFRVETENGCWDTITGKIAITEFVRLFIPTAFTPNGDGLNDFFEVKGTPVSDFNLYIYDRWGNQTWSTHNFEFQWDGNDYKGNPVPSGTYIYQITGTDYKLDPVSYRGTVTVVR